MAGAQGKAVLGRDPVQEGLPRSRGRGEHLQGPVGSGGHLLGRGSEGRSWVQLESSLGLSLPGALSTSATTWLCPSGTERGFLCLCQPVISWRSPSGESVTSAFSSEWHSQLSSAEVSAHCSWIVGALAP